MITATSLAHHGVAYAGVITRAARDHGLNPALLAAVAAQETGGPDTNAGRNVVGDGGHGRGLFQIDDRFHRFAHTSSAMQPAQNADYAATMLSGLLHRYGSVHRALSAYNAGDPDARGTVTQWRDGTRLGYADSVLRHEARIEGSTFLRPATRDATPDLLPRSVAAVQSLDAQALPSPLTLPPPAHHHHHHHHPFVTPESDAISDASDDT